MKLIVVLNFIIFSTFSCISQVMTEPITPGQSASGFGYLYTHNTNLYMSAMAPIVGNELFIYENSGAPNLVSDIHQNLYSSIPNTFVSFGGKLIFLAQDSINGGADLFTYDEVNPPIKIHNASPGMASVNGDGRAAYAELNGKLYFTGNDNTYGKELWEYDGQSQPHIIYDLLPGGEGSYPFNFYNYNDTIYFSATSGTTGSAVHEMYKFDGVNNPQKMLDSGQYCYNFIPSHFEDSFYFSREDSAHGKELWKINENNDTLFVYDFEPGPEDSYPRFLDIYWNNQILIKTIINFEAQYWFFDGINEPELFDGNFWNVEITPTIVYNNKIYCQANDGLHGQELWEYDGINPPVMYDINTYQNLGSYPSNFYIHDNKLFFSAQTFEESTELWYLDSSSTIGLVSQEIQFIETYPNPTDGSFKIQFSENLFEHLNLKIFNIIGEIVHFENNISKNQLINLKVQNGTYFLSFYNEDKLISTEKLIVH